MAKGKTLWEMLVERLRGGPVEFRFFNPLKAKVGSYLTLDEFDLKDLDFRIEEVRESRRSLGGRDYLSVDYVVRARPLGKEEVLRRLRLVPVDDPARAGGLTHHALLLRLDDEMAYNDEFHTILNDGTGEFRVLEDGVVKEIFRRINDVRAPYRAQVAVVADEDKDGVAETDEVRRLTVEYWDYERDVTTPAGLPQKEYLFVEMDRDAGWFQIWRGGAIDLERAVLV